MVHWSPLSPKGTTQLPRVAHRFDIYSHYETIHVLVPQHLYASRASTVLLLLLLDTNPSRDHVGSKQQRYPRLGGPIDHC